jgi:hypothetical protein
VTSAESAHLGVELSEAGLAMVVHDENGLDHGLLSSRCFRVMTTISDLGNSATGVVEVHTQLCSAKKVAAPLPAISKQLRRRPPLLRARS